MKSLSKELQDIAQIEVARAVDGGFHAIKQRFGHMDDTCLSAVVLLLCAKTLETAGFEIARVPNPSLATRLILVSAEMDAKAHNQWEICDQSRTSVVTQLRR